MPASAALIASGITNPSPSLARIETPKRNWSLIISLISLLIALGSPTIAYRQFRLAERTFVANLEESHLSQRAWLSYDTLLLLKPPTAGEPLQTRLSFKNTGSTPALDVRFGGEFYCSNSQQADPTSTNLFADSKIFLAPGMTFCPVSTNQPPLSSNLVANLRAGVSTLYFSSTLDYKDVFNRRHITRCRARYEPGIGFVAAAEGNEAD